VPVGGYRVHDKEIETGGEPLVVDPVQPVLVALGTPLADELAAQNRKSGRKRKWDQPALGRR